MQTSDSIIKSTLKDGMRFVLILLSYNVDSY